MEADVRACRTTSKEARLHEYIAAAELEGLTPEEVKAIDEAGAKETHRHFVSPPLSLTSLNYGRMYGADWTCSRWFAALRADELLALGLGSRSRSRLLFCASRG